MAASAGQEKPSFEESLARLEAIVHELEEGQIGLEEALARYEEGVRLLRDCLGILQTAEQRIELLSAVDASGMPIVQSFDDNGGDDMAKKAASRSRRRSVSEEKTGDKSI